MIIRTLRLAVLFFGCVLAQLSHAAPTPAGPSFALPIYAEAFAASPQGDFVVAWTVRLDTDLVHFQRFAADRSPLGPATAVVSPGSVTDYSSLPALAWDPTGGFILAWVRGNDYLFVQRFDASGLARDPVPIVVNGMAKVRTYPYHPAVAVRADGAFAVAWTGAGPLSREKERIFVRGFAANGLPYGREFQLSEFRGGQNPFGVQLAFTDRGLVAAWQEYAFESAPPFRYFHRGTYLRYAGIAGLNLGPEQRIDRLPDSGVQEIPFYVGKGPAIATAADGYFGVVWQIGAAIRARRFVAPATALDSAEFTVGASAIGRAPAVGLDGGDRLHFGWTRYSPTATPQLQVYGRRFDAHGVAIDTPAFRIDDGTSDVRAPWLAVRPDGSFMALYFDGSTEVWRARFFTP